MGSRPTNGDENSRIDRSLGVCRDEKTQIWDPRRLASRNILYFMFHRTQWYENAQIPACKTTPSRYLTLE